MKEIWRPLGVEAPHQTEQYDTLVDGVPPWMETAFWTWVYTAFHGPTSVDVRLQTGREREFDTGLAMQFELACRVRVGFTNPHDGFLSLQAAVQARSAQLVLADFVISLESTKAPLVEALDGILQGGGSKWKVGDRAGKRGLVQRVPQGVQASVDRAVRDSGHAGQRLAEAWAAAYGIRPNPSHAYRLAVMAVEDAAKPVVSPKDKLATLGKINKVMGDQAGWSLPMPREDPSATSKATVLSMMKMLWAGQADRHGGDPDPALVITQEAAETAVVMAATLVQWFASGVIQRR